MKEQNEKEVKKEKKQRKKISGEKRFYMLTAIGCAVALVAIVVVAVAVSGGKVENNQANNQPVQSTPLPDDSNTNGEGNHDDEQVSGLPEGMISPLESVTVLNDYGFYHNKTLNAYYEHAGVDFTATAGTNVLAVENGVIESIYKDDILIGTEIVINHGNGLKSVYCYVTESEGLKAGDSVKKGDIIGVVAEANGKEYKDGAHLHFEIVKEGNRVDPASYLTLEEK